MLELNREEEAETYLLKAIDFLEDDYQLAEAYELLGNVYLNHKKDYKNAEKCFLRAVENGNVSGYYHLAKIYEHENKFSKAE
jgi:TPR repeat protein